MFPNRQKFNLDGTWIFIPDPEHTGEEQGWFGSPPSEKSIKIEIPQKEPISPDLNPTATTFWFYKEFEISDLSDNYLFFLHFSYINFSASFWLNGSYIGKHIGGAFSHFQINVTKYIKRGSNLLSVKIFPFSLQEATNNKLIYEPSWLPYPGIWGNVYLETRNPTYIQKAFARSDILGKMLIIYVYTNQKGGNFKVILPELNIKTTSNHPKIVLPLKNFELWSPESPKLYDLVIEYHNENYVDIARFKLGIRDFSARDNSFILNFKPFIVKALLYEWELNEINTAVLSEEVLKENISLAKSAGFNLILSYGKPFPEKVLNLCDELGMLCAETASLKFCQDNYKWQKVVEREIDEILTSQVNHPSLIWIHTEDESTISEQKTMFHYLRKIDRSRFISYHTKNSDTQSYSYCIPYKVDVFPMKYITISPQQYINTHTRYFWEQIGDEEFLNFVITNIPKTATFKTELSTLNKLWHKIKQGFEERDLELTFNSVENMLEQIKEFHITQIHKYINLLYKNTNIAGHCITSLNRSIFSFLDNFSESLKCSDTLLKNFSLVNHNFHLNLSLEKENLVQGEESPITISLSPLINKDFIKSNIDAESTITLNVQIISPAHQMLWKKRKNIKLRPNMTKLWEGDISGSSNVGTHLLVAQLISDNNVLAETKTNYYVCPPPKSVKTPVKIIESNGRWENICSSWCGKKTTYPHVYIIPPIANTIFGYPEEEFLSMLEHVRHGAVGIIFSPPDDWNKLKDILDDCPQFTTSDLNLYLEGSHFHYAKPHPVFLNLPNRCIMKEPFYNIIPSKVILEKGDEDICGCLVFPNQEGEGPFWANDIFVQRYGVGKLIFTHLRILENIPEDPIATHMFTNMVEYFSRRAVPSNKPLPIAQPLLERIRKVKEKYLRKWMVIAEFPILKTEEERQHYYPSHKSLGLKESFYGKYGKILWNTWFTNSQNRHHLDFHKAIENHIPPHYLEQDNGVAFAFAEFNFEDNMEVILRLETSNPIKLWFNNSLIIENPNTSHEVQIFESKLTLKRWKNNIFIECMKEKGKHGFSVHFFDTQRNPLNINW